MVATREFSDFRITSASVGIIMLTALSPAPCDAA
jgi:hypothetical protein